MCGRQRQRSHDDVKIEMGSLLERKPHGLMLQSDASKPGTTVSTLDILKQKNEQKKSYAWQLYDEIKGIKLTAQRIDLK